MERRPLATRIRWDNVARAAFVAGLAALVVWWPGAPGGPASLPPDVGVTQAPRPRVKQADPPVRQPVERVRGRKERRPQRRARTPPKRRRQLPSPAPVAPPPPPAPPPAPGGEFGP